ncbi:MAG: cell division protein FtsH, partial [Chloroflexi bacterium]|nr:cell division protein FtsH [Chloroflexota bacterium]
MDAKWLRNSFIYLLILVAAVALFFSLFPGANAPGGAQGGKAATLSQALHEIKNGNARAVVVEGERIIVDTRDSRKLVAQKEASANIFEVLRGAGVEQKTIDALEIDIRRPAELGNWLGVALQFLPFLFLAGFLLFMMRQAQGSNNQALSFGKSRARMFLGNKPSITFADVAGVEEAKQELQEVVEFLKYPEKFASLGARIPRGVLLVGP